MGKLSVKRSVLDVRGLLSYGKIVGERGAPGARGFLSYGQYCRGKGRPRCTGVPFVWENGRGKGVSQMYEGSARMGKIIGEMGVPDVRDSFRMGKLSVNGCLRCTGVPRV